MTDRQRLVDLPLPQQAGILCNDPGFQRFVGQRLDLPPVTPSAAAEYLRQACGITTRRALATDRAAATKFRTLRTEFDAWSGRLATPR